MQQLQQLAFRSHREFPLPGWMNFQGYFKGVERSQAEKGATRQRRAQYNRAILPEAVFVESLVKFAISPLACHKRR